MSEIERTIARDDAGARLWWGLRTYGWLFSLIVIGVVGLSLVVGPKTLGTKKDYRASALVVASDLVIKPDGLPRLAEAVFEAGSVAENAVISGTLPFEANELIPRKAELVTIQDTVALEVVGIDRDPAMAARIANSVAQALVNALNKAGPRLGTFILQDTARPPKDPEVVASRELALAVGGGAGIALGLGIVALLMLVRRPVLSPAEAGSLAGAQVLGILTMPKVGASKAINPVLVHGLTAFVVRLDLGRDGMCAIVSCGGGDETVRSQLSFLVARLLSRRRSVYLVRGHGEKTARAYESFETGPNMIVVEELPANQTWQAPIVIDGPSSKEFDLPQVLPASARVILVIREGTRFTSVESAVDQFLPGDIAGLVFIRQRRVFPFGTPSAGAARPARDAVFEEPSEAPVEPPTPVASEPPADVAPPVDKPASPVSSPGGEPAREKLRTLDRAPAPKPRVVDLDALTDLPKREPSPAAPARQRDEAPVPNDATAYNGETESTPSEGAAQLPPGGTT